MFEYVWRAAVNRVRRSVYQSKQSKQRVDKPFGPSNICLREARVSLSLVLLLVLWETYWGKPVGSFLFVHS